MAYLKIIKKAPRLRKLWLIITNEAAKNLRNRKLFFFELVLADKKGIKYIRSEFIFS